MFFAPRLVAGPRARAGRIFLAFFAALGLCFPTLLHASFCTNVLAAAESILFPVPFNEGKYNDALAAWSDLLSASSADSLESKILERLGEEGSFESQAALLGAMLPEQPFLESIKDLQNKSIDVYSRDVPKRLAFGNVVSKVRWAGLLRGRFPKSPSAVVFSIKRSRPETTLDWVQNLVAISEGFRKAETAALSRNAPWVSTPLYSGKYSYPRAFVAQLEQSASRTYAFLKSVRERFPDLEWQLKERSQRPLGWAGTSIGVGFYFVWMFYDPLKRYVPTEEGYRAWLESPESFTCFLEQRYINRARIQFAATVSKRLFKTALVVGATSASVAFGSYYFSGNAKAMGTQLHGILNTAADAKKNAAAAKAYQERPGGDPAVVKHFNDKIKAVEKEIESFGDSAERRSRIEAFEALRDELKN